KFGSSYVQPTKDLLCRLRPTTCALKKLLMVWSIYVGSSLQAVTSGSIFFAEPWTSPTESTERTRISLSLRLKKKYRITFLSSGMECLLARPRFSRGSQLPISLYDQQNSAPRRSGCAGGGGV